MTVKLLTGHHLEFLSLKESWTGSPESTLVKIPHFWKSHAAAHIIQQWDLVTNSHNISYAFSPTL